MRHEILRELLVEAWISKGRSIDQISDQVLAVWHKHLSGCDTQLVSDAFERWNLDREQRHPPTLADIRAMVAEALTGSWMTPDEAWSVAIRAMDEAETVVWCDEIAQAWGVAQPIAKSGDKIGARMAFRDAYARLVKQAKTEGRGPKVTVTLGHDLERRRIAIQFAADTGLLSADQATRYLPQPVAKMADVQQLLLTGDSVTDPETARARLSALRDGLKRTARRTESDSGQTLQAGA